MALLDPASISLGEEEEEEEEQVEQVEQVMDSGCIPTVGASLVVDEQDDTTGRSRSVKDDHNTRVCCHYCL